ncbi:MAG: peptidoglycan DD-metalloendopeptidase family protein [Synergistaceae bacterium]|nr:peptidoglycan DD-metalloendopeptidase family protein [Synergistaceae bacterium]
MKKTNKKVFLFVTWAITLVLSYFCINYAAKQSGAFWYIANAAEGIDSYYYVGYVVVDAIDSRDAIGPFKGNDLSMMSDDVEMMEEDEDGDPRTWANEPDVTSGDWKFLIVNSGETLSKISETYDISIENLMKANELTDQHRIREGQQLYIPNSAGAVEVTLQHVRSLKNAEVAKLKQASPVELTDYVVRNGDTLWKIANDFNLDVNSIFGSNKLSEGSVLKVGSTVKIPNQDGIFITVKKGHTLEKLAKEYSIYEEAIVSANKLSGALSEGSRLFLPGAKVAAAVDSGGSNKSTASNAKSSIAARKSFGWPVVGKISSSYGWRRDPIRRNTRDFHTGLDIRAPRGRTVVAAAAGKVVHAGWMGGYGQTVVISHPGGLTTLYGHCSRLLVRVGANVNRGHSIAQVGSTGRSTGNHLHFEVRSGGKPANPIKYLR